MFIDTYCLPLMNCYDSLHNKQMFCVCLDSYTVGRQNVQFCIQNREPIEISLVEYVKKFVWLYPWHFVTNAVGLSTNHFASDNVSLTSMNEIINQNLSQIIC